MAGLIKEIDDVVICTREEETLNCNNITTDDIPMLNENEVGSFLGNDSSSYNPFLDLLDTSINEDSTILTTNISSGEPIQDSCDFESIMNSIDTSSLLSFNNNADGISFEDIFQQPCLETLNSFGNVSGSHDQFVDTGNHNLFQPNQLMSEQPTYQNWGSSVEQGLTGLNFESQSQVQQPCYASPLPDQGQVSNISELPWTAPFLRENHGGWKSTVRSDQARSNLGNTVRISAEFVKILNEINDSALRPTIHFPDNPSSLSFGNYQQPNQVAARLNQGILGLDQARAVLQNQVPTPLSQSRAVLSMDKVSEALNIDHALPLMLNQHVPVGLNRIPPPPEVLSYQVSEPVPSHPRVERRRQYRGGRGSGRQSHLTPPRRGRPPRNRAGSSRSEELNLTPPIDISNLPVTLAPPGDIPHPMQPTNLGLSRGQNAE